MGVPLHEQKILFAKSGNCCAFQDCYRNLTADASPPDRIVVLGEVAHIVAESLQGPRGNSSLTLEERNRYDNLMLLCSQHHQLIDAQPQTYTVARLHAMKDKHEQWVAQRLESEPDQPIVVLPNIREIVHSTLLPVERMPAHVYGIPCDESSEKIVQGQLGMFRGREMAPFILKGGMLYAFQDLNDRGSPFSALADGQPVERFRVAEWLEDPDRFRWFVDLLNRSLNKLTGRRGLMYDREHRRYYFPADEPGKVRKVDYTPLNKKRTSRNVVWEPKGRATGEGRGYWYHRAVALRFLLTGKGQWCLSMRPELRVTSDGVKPLASEKIGSKVTRKKSRTFNYDLLGEVQFWRDFLGDTRPRIVLPFGDGPHYQYLQISTTLMHGTIDWPGIPEEHAKAFKNVQFVDDLFSWAERRQLDAMEDDVDDEDWDEGVEGDLDENG